jgi:hypothetical protein
MSRNSTHLITACLIGTGVAAWAFAGRPLVTNKDLAVPLNPLGLNRSPYGEVIAMAMQGPVDTYFDFGMSGSAPHQHAEGETCDHECEHDHDSKNMSQPQLSPKQRLDVFLTSLDEAVEIRTNPKAASEALKLHLRRQAEDKLRFAYQLDPSHYGNYNSLHFFLTEPQVGTRPELTPSAGKLAQDTITYCLNQEKDPRPALTAAAAATNILHLMFADHQNKQPKFTTTQMRNCLSIVDQSLARYDSIAQEWERSKNWELLSPQRITECADRLSFITKIRDAAEKTIIRIEAEHQLQASN